MFKRILFAVAALASFGLAAPAGNPSDFDVLQFALSLEHLENAFYTAALARFSQQDFEDAGFPGWVYGRFVQLARHEKVHVAFLTGILGDIAVQPCEYNFGSSLDSPRAFAQMSMIFETVGGSAYLGGAKLLQNKDYLTAAGSILAVESRQASWISSSVLELQPWNGPFDIPLTASGAFSLAQPFITKCPPSNAPLPVKLFPKLTLGTITPAHGSRVSVQFDGCSSEQQKFIAWYDGLKVEFTDLKQDGTTKVPEDLMGTVYAVAVSSEETPSDDNMLSGAAIAQFPFSSQARENT